MGVDAEYRVTWDQPLTDDQIVELSEDLEEASDDGNLSYDDARRAVGRYEPPAWAAEEPWWEEEPATVLIVHTGGSRYYGEGYERGALGAFVLWAEWFERRLPGCRVWYGDDSSYHFILFDQARRSELLDHWARVGHRPYRGTMANPTPLAHP